MWVRGFIIMESIDYNGKKRYFLSIPTRTNQECDIANCNCMRIQAKISDCGSGILTCADEDKIADAGSLPRPVKSFCESVDAKKVEFQVRKSKKPERFKLRSCDLQLKDQVMEEIAPSRQMSQPDTTGRVKCDDSVQKDFRRSGKASRLSELKQMQVLERKYRDFRVKHSEKISRYVEKYIKNSDLIESSSNCDGLDVALNADSDRNDSYPFCSQEVECKIFSKEDVDIKDKSKQQQDCSEDYFVCLICDSVYEALEEVQIDVAEHLINDRKEAARKERYGLC